MNKRGRAVSQTSESRSYEISGKSFLQWIGSVLGKILGLLSILLIIGLIIWGVVIGFNLYRSGDTSVAVAHGEAAVEQPKNLATNFLYKTFPNVYRLTFGSGFSSLGYETEVEQNQVARDLGVRITKFVPVKNIYFQGEPLRFTGTIQAKSLEDTTIIEAYCRINDIESVPSPARILGTNADGNRAVISKSQTAAGPVAFNVQCEIPGIDVKNSLKQGVVAELIIVHGFVTRATQKVYFVSSDTHNSLSSRGVDPFDYFSINDPLLDSNKRIRTKSTAAPLAVILGIDVPQPLTDSSSGDNFYQLTVQLEPNVGWTGRLERIDSFELQVPDVNDLELVLEGESGYSSSGTSDCGFEFVGNNPDGFKVYKLSDYSLTNVNRDCSKKSLRGLALSEDECIDLFKTGPTFICNFKAVRVPDIGMQFDNIRADARYVYSVNRKAAVEVRKRPEDGA